MTKKGAFVVLMCVALGGCAVGRTHDYLLSHPTLRCASKERLAVGVQDRRPYILNHDKGENFVGSQEGGYGIRFDVRTASGLPLAEDMTKVLASALAQPENVVTSLKISPTMGRAEVIRSFQTNNAEKAILLSLYDWRAHTGTRTSAFYNVKMEVLDSKGDVLARKRVQGTDGLEGSFWQGAQSKAQTGMPMIFQKKLEELFEGDIAAALDKQSTGAGFR